MELRFVATLDAQADLYSEPPSMERFQRYLSLLTGGAGSTDIALPIGLVNPMGKEHCAEVVAALQSLDAEAIVAGAVDEAAARLPPGLPASVCLNVLDDLAGGWTNRFFYELELRFGSERGERAARSFRLIVVPAWTSEDQDPGRLRARTLAAIYRRAWMDKNGRPEVLSEQVLMEGRALRFAGVTSACLDEPASEDLDSAARIASQYGNARTAPILAAFWFGDKVAVDLGYTPLGLGPNAGFRLALQRAQASPDPLTGDREGPA